MIRLSANSIARFLNTTETIDLDLTPLYLYEFDVANVVQRQFVQDDTRTINSREFSYAPNLQNILLDPTPAFYPEQQISAGFHDAAKLQNILSTTTLPAMQYNNMELLFSAGFGYNDTFRGVSIRVFCKLSNGREVTLAAIRDFAEESNIVASDNVLFESTLYNSRISFQIPDVDYILNSTDSDIITLKNRVFGSDIPTHIYFQYSALNAENIDTLNLNGFDYKQLNFSILHDAALDFTIQKNANVFASLQMNDNRTALLSQMKNALYDVESYLNRFKTDEQTYTVSHSFSTNYYDDSNTLIGTKVVTMLNPVNKFDAIEYRPLLDDNTDHFSTTVSISIRNESTGLTFTKSSMLNVVDAVIVDRFRLNSTGITLSVTSETVFNRLEQQINTVAIDNDVPSIVEVVKPIYITLETVADTLTLLPGEFTTKIITNTDLSAITTTYLKIGNIVVQSLSTDKTTFSVPATAYNTSETNFFLLDQSNAVITSGKITKK